LAQAFGQGPDKILLVFAGMADENVSFHVRLAIDRRIGAQGVDAGRSFVFGGAVFSRLP